MNMYGRFEVTDDGRGLCDVEGRVEIPWRKYDFPSRDGEIGWNLIDLMLWSVDLL
jgi:hypothetical protein